MEKLILSVLLAFGICLVTGPLLIPLLQKLKFGQFIRDDGPQSHLAKKNTPTMGGMMMIAAILIASLVIGGGSSDFLPMMLVATVGYGLIGFLDDILKIKNKRSLGLRAYQKMIGQVGLAIVIAVWAYNNPMIGSTISIPFTDVTWDLGWFAIPFNVFVVVAFVNAVNLTDGLDGLASGVMMIDSVAYAFIFSALAGAAALKGNALLSADMESAMVFAGAVGGACLGFLRFNSYPARVFMGDTGSLALGGAFSVFAVVSGTQLLSVIMGMMFVASAVSVVLQVGSYKLRNKKRIFLMAPLHHHYELKGYTETKIVSMYMIITTAACLVALLLYV